MLFSKFFDKYANWLAIFSLLLFIFFAASINKLDMIDAYISNKDVEATISGGCEKELSPYLNNSIEIHSRITYCASGDADLHKIEVSEFYSSGNFFIYTAGYFNNNVSLVFEVDGKPILPVNDINSAPGETWTVQKIQLPYKGEKRVKISLIDQGASFKEWAGLSVPSYRQTLEIVYQIKVILWLILFLIISIAITNFCYRIIMRYTQSENVVAPSIFISLCGIYYLSFWVYFYLHDVGLLFSYLIIFTSVYLLFRSLFNGSFIDSFKSSGILKLYIMPIIYVVILFSFCMTYEDLSSIQKSTAKIFTHELPIDNFLPKIFADQVYGGKVASPMIGDWLSSDRPPLQTGQFLLFYKLFLGGDVGYQLNSMLLQAYFLVPVVLLLNKVLKTTGILKFAIIMSIAFSSVTLVNTIYVWPKLVAGTALLFVIYILFNSSLYKSRITPIVLSVALAMASMLAHSGSIFSLVPIALASFVVFKPSMKDSAIAVVLAAVIFGPWLGYQKLIDPPGDRLIKWHLAGQVEVSSDSFSKTFSRVYAEAPIEQVLATKASNFGKVFEGVLSYDYLTTPIAILFDKSSSKSSVDNIKTKLFFNFFYSMGIIFILGISALVTLLITKRSSIVDLSFLLFFITSTTSLIIWCILMFESGSTVIHQGAYFPWLALMIFFSILIALVFKQLSISIFALHFFINFSIYFLSVIINEPVINTLFISVFVASFIVFVSFTFKFIRDFDVKSDIQEFV